MPSTYSSKLRIELIANGEQAAVWGSTTNSNLGTLIENSIAGTATVILPSGAGDYTLTALNGVDDEARQAVLKITAALTANRNVICPSTSKKYLVYNATTGAFTVTLKTAAGTGVLIPQNNYVYVYCDGTNVVDVNVSGAIHAASSKATPVDADELPLTDSATSFSLKKLTWANLKATLVATANTWSAAQTFSGGLVGTTTNDSAAAGSIGEYISSSVAQGSPVSLTSTVAANITSISLTAGDWDVWGMVGFVGNASTTCTYWHGSISNTSGTNDSSNGRMIGGRMAADSFANTSYNSFAHHGTRISLASTTTIYLVADLAFAVSTAGAYGIIQARRRR